MDDVTSDTGSGDLDIASAVESIGLDLFPQSQTDTDTDTEVEEAPVPTSAAPVTETASAPTVAERRQAPKSWGREHHESWDKIDPKAQEYIEQRERQMLEGLGQYKTDATYGKSLRDILTPYRPILAAGGMDEATAVQTLLNAHYRLTQGDPQSRKQAFYELGQNLGFLQGQQAQPVDPQVQALQQQVTEMQRRDYDRDQRTHSEVRGRIEHDVATFAADPAHPFFDDVADDIIAMIRSGAPLQEAYDKAVWANPVTRQKQLATFQTEQTAKLRDEAKQTATKARQAMGVNVKGRDSRQAPTEPKGSMDDTMASILADIKSRTT